MKPTPSQAGTQQNELFLLRFSEFLDVRHPLFRFAQQIDWNALEQQFGGLYHAEIGSPGLPTRLLVGLHYLKATFNESDEDVVAKWVENPYWQYFCGFEFFQHELPCHPTALVKWRQRVASAGLEKLLAEVLATIVRTGVLKADDCKSVIADTTVQEKAIAFPTDARLAHKARVTIVREAKRAGIELRQSFARVGKKALFKQQMYARTRKPKQAAKETKKLRNYLGRVLRDSERKYPNPKEKFKELLERAARIYTQNRTTKRSSTACTRPKWSALRKARRTKNMNSVARSPLRQRQNRTGSSASPRYMATPTTARRSRRALTRLKNSPESALPKC